MVSTTLTIAFGSLLVLSVCSIASALSIAPPSAGVGGLKCLTNADCAGELACLNGRCNNPCPGTCGTNANCVTKNHLPLCSCLPGYTGDPFIICSLPKLPIQEVLLHPLAKP